MAAGQKLTAGRSESNDIEIAHPTVSRRHIELRVNGDGSFDVFDLGASAGTFVFHKGEWTKFGHATVAADERLRLGSYETTAGALFAMAGDSVDGEPGDLAPAEDIHEVSTRRRGGRQNLAAKEDMEDEERTTRRSNAGATKKIANPSKKPPQTQKLPAGHATPGSKSGPSSRAAPSQAGPQASSAETAAKIDASSEPPAAASDISGPGSLEQRAAKSLTVTYLLWFFLGSFGAHRFYLGSIAIGITHATLLVAGVAPIVVFGGALYDEVLPTIFVLLGVAVLTCLVVWLAVDGFLIPGLIRDRRGKPGAGA